MDHISSLQCPASSRPSLRSLCSVGLTAIVLAVCVVPALSQSRKADTERWKRRAAQVTIIRDDWGIPHVYAKSDADAVFGMIYAQAEDDFNRVEMNYINAMGRLAEAEGEAAIYQDLRMKLFIDPDSMRSLYRSSPEWLRHLMDGFADGLNYYLATHPAVKPRVIRRFEPWMALTFSEGSIGGDIERISTRDLGTFYGAHAEEKEFLPGDGMPPDPGGSNGIAIAPFNTTDRRALLLINPHTSFFFRAELQMVSEEGLNAYGAVTWGQLFVYQGFNNRVGWMHTSSGVDAIDEYLETIVQKNGHPYYKYGNELRPVSVSTISVPYKTDKGMAKKVFTVYRTHHGPVVRESEGTWVTVRMMQDPMHALMQSFSRTKARTFAEFRKSMELHTNSSNNTVYADADGTIAYLHANFVPRRDTRFDWTRPVDGSIPASEWNGLLSFEESPNIINPPNGWLFNTNNAPWTAAGEFSPKKMDYPSYVQGGGENARGMHATRVLTGRKDFTLSSLITAAFDSYLPAFERLVPTLSTAYDALRPNDTLRTSLKEQMEMLRTWDLRWSTNSIATSLAIAWAGALGQSVRGEPFWSSGLSFEDYMVERVPAADRLAALATASRKLSMDFGTWKTPWGEINRFQRITGDIVQPFTDNGPSIPVGFTAGQWGSLAAFGSRAYPGTKKYYGTSGNSFVAVVEFGDSVRAKAVTAGGLSGDPKSPHFNDQAERYATGHLRDVYFYRTQLVGHTERMYRPGE